MVEVPCARSGPGELCIWYGTLHRAQAPNGSTCDDFCCAGKEQVKRQGCYCCCYATASLLLCYCYTVAILLLLLLCCCCYCHTEQELQKSDSTLVTHAAEHSAGGKKVHMLWLLKKQNPPEVAFQRHQLL